MKILISTFGTRGDVQPYIALGLGLKAAGYTVALFTAEGYKPLVEGHGLHYAFMRNDLLELSQAILARRGDTMAVMKQMLAAMRQMLMDEWQAAQAFAPDAIVYHPKVLGSYHIAEKLDIPVFMALPLPFYTPTSAFPNPFLASVRIGNWFNRLSFHLLGLSSAMYVGMTNRFRTRILGLPRRGRFADPLVTHTGEPVTVLYPYSRHLLPVPVDFPSHVHVTGSWFLDTPATWQPDPALEDFLASGPPPVYIGFGSMSGIRAEQRVSTVLDALARSGQRGILARGWGGSTAADTTEQVFVLDEVPHDWLFPQVAAVVHHGGAGTTAAGLRAGKPTIICPFLGDQAFWGRVVYERGVGPQPIPQKRLTAARLADAMTTAVTDTTMQQQAADMGNKIRAEDGVAHAVEIISQTVGKRTSCGTRTGSYHSFGEQG